MNKVFLIIGIASMIACKATSDSSTTSAKTSEISTETTSKQVDSYDVIVQFISKGAGIDNDLFNKFQGAMARFNKEQGLNLKADRKPWGREGEFDLQYNLKDLSTKQKQKFNDLLDSVVGKTDMVHIKRK